jgi:hypothetical protein
MFWKAPIKPSGLAEEEILRLQGLNNDWPLPESCIVSGAVAMIGDDETEGRRRSEVEPKFAWQLWYCKDDRLQPKSCITVDMCGTIRLNVLAGSGQKHRLRCCDRHA